MSERLAGLKALAATTGTLLWSNQTTIDHAYPKIDGDKLLTFSTSTNLTAYNKNNGNVYWNVPDIGGGDPAPLINTGQGNLFYYKTVNGSALIAHDLQTGDFKWSKPVSAAVFNLRTPVIDNDNVLITSLTHVAVFKAATGAPVSIIEGELSINGDVSAVNNVAFLACKSSGFPDYIKGHVTAYNISNGTRLWRSTERNDFMTTPCIITSNDKMYRGGHLY